MSDKEMLTITLSAKDLNALREAAILTMKAMPTHIRGKKRWMEFNDALNNMRAEIARVQR